MPHGKLHRSRDAPLWITAGLVFACLLALTSALVRNTATEAADETSERPAAAPYRLDLARGDSILRLTGLIDFGITRDLEALLEESPEVRTIRLQSVGGRVAEARGLARLVHRFGLVASAAVECSSACTLVLLSADRRYLEPGARLGFHRYGLHSPLVGAFLDPAHEQASDQALFRGQPVSEAFLDRVAATPHSGMWFPSPQQLLDAGVVDRIALPE